MAIEITVGIPNPFTLFWVDGTCSFILAGDMNDAMRFSRPGASVADLDFCLPEDRRNDYTYSAEKKRWVPVGKLAGRGTTARIVEPAPQPPTEQEG